jgi:hypothetical protein
MPILFNAIVYSFSNFSNGRFPALGPLPIVERRKVVMRNVPENADEPEVASEPAADELDLADSDLEEVSAGWTGFSTTSSTCR